jgi:tetratricopeptide (TPR) repeat protein
MNTVNFKKTIGLVTFALLSYSLAFAAGEKAEKAAKLTDMAALNIQDRSINKLQSLLKQYRGTSREPEFLARLADLYLERSGISFRISEGTSVKTKTTLYSGSLKDSIRVLSELINKYPYHVQVPLGRFKRAKAYKELNQIKEARADYLYIDQHYADFPFLDSALIDLADFAQDANHHEEALTYLSKIEKMPGSGYYPIALHKSAWSYFNLANYQTGVEYLKKEINFYYDKKDGTAEIAFIESGYNDLALFYFEAINKQASFASVDKAVDLFQDLDRTHKYFGTTTLKFARLLKAYTLIPQLDALKKRLISDFIKMPETAEVALLLFQFHFERHDYNNLAPVLVDLNKIRNSVQSKELDQKVESALAGALTELHKLVIKNKKSTEVGTLVRPLVSLTESVGDLLGDDNATALLANYSLAETSFELQDFARSTQIYQNLLNPKYAPILEGRKISQQSLSLRLISSRYRELKKEQLIPEKLTIRALSSKVSPASKEQIGKMKAWIEWIDQQVLSMTDKTPVEDRQSFDAFTLEASKLTYEYLDEATALTRLETFAFAHPDTQEGVTSISIVLDSVSKSEDWKRLYDTTQKVLAIKNWKEKTFLEHVTEMTASSHLKLTLMSDQPEVVLQRTQECSEKFKSVKTAEKTYQECLIIQAKTELKLNQPEKAEHELNQLMSMIKDEAKIKSMLLLRADARSKIGKMPEAIHDLTQYQTLTEFKDADITQNILQHYWFKHDYTHLDSLLKNKKVCSGSNADICEQYSVVRILDEGRDAGMKYQTVFKNTVKAPKNLVSVWALAALHEPKKLPFQDRMILLQRLAGHWENMNPLLQIHLLPLMQTRVKDTLESVRMSAPGIAPLTSDSATIERRMRLMQDIDMTFAKVMKLNWLEVKLKGASELAIIYERLVQDLRAIQTPEDLLKPFIQKGKEVNEAVQSLREMAMNYTPAPVQAKADRQIASSPNPLLSKEVETRVPANLWNEWKSGVQENRRDYLFYLISLMESGNESFKGFSPILRGLVLVGGEAPTEAFELIKSGEESPWKATLLTQFQSQQNQPQEMKQ